MHPKRESREQWISILTFLQIVVLVFLRHGNIEVLKDETCEIIIIFHFNTLEVARKNSQKRARYPCEARDKKSKRDGIKTVKESLFGLPHMRRWQKKQPKPYFLPSQS